MSNLNGEEQDRKRPASISPMKARKNPRAGSSNCNDNDNDNDSSSSSSGTNFQVENLVQSGSEKREMYTRCNDEVHQSIDCCPLMQKIIDTWPMQRLRDIRQLGTSFLVYPCANHTRFEHSIGVGHLARQMCSRLRERHTSFGVTNKDVLCVTLAGLLHDTGHGPFSHLYEVFRKEVNEELERDPKKRELYQGFPKAETKWSHERSSLMMVDEVLRSLGLAVDMRVENLDKPLKQIGDGISAESIRCYWDDDSDSEDEILTNRDWIFIKECIYGDAIPEVMHELQSNERVGRTDPRHEWLYDIVSNRHNGIDVDKMDYFARDQRRSMSEVGNVDISIINEACVAKAKCNEEKCKRCQSEEYHYQICYPKKCVSRVIEFFKTRGKLHEFIYQHKTTGAGACMLNDILKLADPYYLLPTDDPNTKLPISRAFSNAYAFERMRDSIIDGIMFSTTTELQPARELAQKFKRRELYKLSSEKVLDTKRNKHHAKLWKNAEKNPESIVRAICSESPRHSDGRTGIISELKEEDVIITCASWNQGKKEKNPLDFVRFVEKSAPSFGRDKDHNQLAKQIGDEDHQMFITRQFQKDVIRAYCRDPAKKDLLAHAFESFWERAANSAMANTIATPPVNFAFDIDDEAASDASGDYSHDGGTSRFPAQLTQDSCDEGEAYTPVKSPRSRDGPLSSPSPVLRRWP